MTKTHYQSSKGPTLIASMPYPHLKNAADKLRREGREPETLVVMDARLAVLDAEYEAKKLPPPDHNAPPAPPEGFAAIEAHISDLYDEARNWLDGDPIASQSQADEVSRLLGMIREAEQLADKERRGENKPFDDGKAEVQTRYNALIGDTKAVRGKTVLASEACKAALRPWLLRLEQERQEAARRAREEAERVADAARVAAASADPSNLHETERVEAMFDDAQRAAKVVKTIERDRPTAGGGEFRATGLRDNWTPRLIDGREALAHYWKTRRQDLEIFAMGLASADVRSGKRTIPGFEIVNDRVAV